MFTAKLTVTWPDGKSATAELRAESAEQNYPITYAGDVARLGDVPRESDYPFLRFSLQQAAIATGATYTEQLGGTYDRQAGGAEGF